jgi:TRAP-type C4-dicarboxylate transport system substrate-binding protein
MKKFASILCLLAMVLTCLPILGIAAAPARPKYTIKLAHVLPDSAGSAQASVYFKELVKERTNGDIEVQLFPASALGNERDINENLNNGSIQMIYSSPGAMGAAFYPELQVLDAPWLFKSADHAIAIARDPDSVIGGFIKDIYNSTNIQILDMWYRAPRHIFTRSSRIVTPQDCAGVKLRSPEIEVYFGSLAAIGFSVTPVAYSETYSAIQTGVVEGLEGPFDLTWGMKFQEVTRNVSLLGWNSGLGPIAINKNFYNKLPEEYQKIISECAIKAGDRNTEITLALEESLLKNFADAGLTVVEPNMESFYAMIDDIVYKISKIWNDGGRELYNKIRNYNF